MALSSQGFDLEYVAKLRDGDPETQAHFTGHFGHLLDIKLRARLRSRQLVEDARQETLLRVFATLRDSSKRQPENLGAFVHAVSTNVLFEMFRKESRTAPMSENSPEPADAGAGPEEQAVTADRRRLVHQVLREMPDRDSQLLRQVFLEERDKDDICRAHSIDREYLRVLVHRAKNRFRTLLESGSQRGAGAS